VRASLALARYKRDALRVQGLSPQRGTPCRIERAGQPGWDESRARNWHLFLPPARPSRGELRHYEQAALAEATRGPGRWALLGSTPEIRSMAARHRQPLTCIDIDAGVFTALAALVEPQCIARLVCADWLADEWESPSEVIFGDGSVNMLPADEQEILVQKARAMLKAGGLALFRVHLASPPRFKDAGEVFAWHRSRAGEEPLFSRTRTDLDMLWLEPETLKVDFAECHQRIRELFERGAITATEFEAYEPLLEFNKISLYYTTRESFEALVARYFEIEWVRTGDDYFGSSNHPIYALRGK
jgi:hypothetical protein